MRLVSVTQPISNKISTRSFVQTGVIDGENLSMIAFIEIPGLDMINDKTAPKNLSNTFLFKDPSILIHGLIIILILLLMSFELETKRKTKRKFQVR